MKTLIYFSICLIAYQVIGQSPCLTHNADSLIVTSNAQVLISSVGELLVTKNGNGFSMPLRTNGKQVPLFGSAGLWIGGKDEAGNLKLAATLKTKNNKADFVPGPLDQSGQSTVDNCSRYDRIFSVTSKEIKEHIDNIAKAKKEKRIYPCDSIATNIRNWPARGNPFFFKNNEPDWLMKNNPTLPDNGAHFYDADYDGYYNPCKGDFPVVRNNIENADWAPLPEVINFWIFNDNSLGHRLTKGDATQIQINAYEYKFATSDEGNDAIYFSYELYPNADSDLRDTYIGLFLDPAMGCTYNDKVAIDTMNSTVVFYNGSKNDEKESQCAGQGSLGYYPYTLALDYKNSLRLPKVFAKDEKGQFIYDKAGNKTIVDPTPGTGDIDTLINGKISSFIVLDNCNTGDEGDCDLVNDDQSAYNLLRGKNVNGTPFLHDSMEVKKMFTGNPIDPNSWSMLSDTSFKGKNIACLMAVGPCMLQPGSVHQFDFSINLVPLKYEMPDLKEVDFLNQINDCKYYYSLIDDRGLGLKSTKLKFRTKSQDAQIEIEIVKEKVVEELKESIYFLDTDMRDSLGEKAFYKFEGYNVYQVKEPYGPFDDDNYKLIMQCDLENEYDRLYNTYPESYSTIDNKVNRRWLKKLMVSGNNKGLNYNVDVGKDYFARPGEDNLIDGKTYYFAIQTYNANNWRTTDMLTGYGQREQFWAGRPRVFSHYYLSKPALKKIRFYCEDETLHLYNLNKGDKIQVTSIEGHQLFDGINDDEAAEKSIKIGDRYSVVFVSVNNESFKTKETYKVMCY